jgi:quercetin dioxygenase-like cupin family protein
VAETANEGGTVGKIAILNGEEIQLSHARDRMDDARRALFGEGEYTSSTRYFFPADDESLQLFEVHLQPDAAVLPHAHTAPEIIYVTQGELRLGARVAEANPAIFVDADTLYGFKAGPEGAVFLNFRGDPEAKYIFKDELVGRLKEANAS